jgi:hypothetical protein
MVFLRNFHIFALVFCLGFSARAEVVNDESAIRKEIAQLSSSEAEAAVAADKLKFRPRAEVLNLLKADLLSGPKIPTSSLKAMVVLEVRELTPELKLLAARTEAWPVINAINQIEASDKEASSEFAKIYLQRIPLTIDAAAKCAFIDGLSAFQTPLTETLYKKLLTDPNSQVRRSSVENFVATLRSLDTLAAKSRLKLALKAKPYQARIVALRHLARLPAGERAELIATLPKNLCSKETQLATKAVCKRIKGATP